jgi:hypothetical protein
METTADNHLSKNRVWRDERVMRWLARTISLLATAIWFLIMLDIILCEFVVGCITITWETAFLVFLVAVSALSVVFAWRREGAGGLAMIIWGLAFTVIAYVTSRPYQLFSILVSGLPFIFAGSLFLASWWRLRSAIQ